MIFFISIFVFLLHAASRIWIDEKKWNKTFYVKIGESENHRTRQDETQSE